MNIEDLRVIQPAFDHNFDIIFAPHLLSADEQLEAVSINPLKGEYPINIPPPFTIGSTLSFPATSCEFDLYNLNSKAFKIGNTTLEIPLDSSPKTIDVIFFDNDNRLLQRWFEDWANRLTTGRNKGTNVLNKVVKNMVINELDSQKNIVNSRSYWVMLKSGLRTRYSGSGGIMLFNQSFTIVGDRNLF